MTGAPLLDWLIYIASALTAGGVVWKKGLHPIIAGLDRLSTIPDRLTAVEEKVTKIDQRTKQLEPNGGSSLYDRVGKVETGQAEMYVELRPMVKAIGTLAQRSNAAESRRKKP